MEPFAALRDFFKWEAAGGVCLVIAATLAIILANSPFAPIYLSFLKIDMEVRIATFQIAKPLLLWINDGLMAVFFLLVGLEIKREFLEGELSSRAQAALPAIGALGGMVMPALIFVAINLGHPEYLTGWAIPAATDIAFALGVLSLLGSRVPISLKVLLTAIAVLDDLGAIVIIAVFYTPDLSVTSLLLAGGALAGLFVLNRFNIQTPAPYLLLGAALWVCVLKSGVHATLAGVALAMAFPMTSKKDGGPSMLRTAEHSLHPWVAFGVLPLFGFANAGVSFDNVGLDSFVDPLKVGIALGLFAGKQIGVFTAFWLMISRGWAKMPEGASWRQLYGLAALCGIGFTMSLFIGGLAWQHEDYADKIRLGVIVGSLASSALGALLLYTAKSRHADDDPPIRSTG